MGKISRSPSRKFWKLPYIPIHNFSISDANALIDTDEEKDDDDRDADYVQPEQHQSDSDNEHEMIDSNDEVDEAAEAEYIPQERTIPQERKCGTRKRLVNKGLARETSGSTRSNPKPPIPAATQGSLVIVKNLPATRSSLRSREQTYSNNFGSATTATVRGNILEEM